MMPTASFFIFAVMAFVPMINAYPMGLHPRQITSDTPEPIACAIVCTRMPQAEPLTATCVQAYALCLAETCMSLEYSAAIQFVDPYCEGKGVVRTANGVSVTDVSPVPTGAAPMTTTVPLSATPSTIFVTEFVTPSDTPQPTIATETSTSIVTVIPNPTATLSVLSLDAVATTLASASTAISTSSIVIESMSSSTALRSPAAISVYIIISIAILILILLFVRRWRRSRQRDYIMPSHRRTRGKSFLIDESSLKRHTFNSAIDLTTKPAPVYTLRLKEEQPLPAVPIPTKDSSDPSAGVALSYVPQLATTRTSTRSYTALPGRSPSLEASPVPEKSFVTQTFAAGRERAITNIRHGREGSRSPTSPSSSISSPTSPNGDMYASATQAPLPAYAYMAPYQPATPSPLRSQLRTKPGPSRVSTIQEEPRTPHGAQSVFSMATTMSPPMSVLNSKVETAQRVRPTFASHVRNPGSSERMHQFTFPNPRQSLKEAEFQITISEAMMDGVPVSRSQTPNGSMHRGAGGSVSSVSKVQGKLQALVDGIRRERE